MIAFEPYLEEVAELAIGGDVGRGEMGMEIEDRERRGKFVIEVASGGIVEEEVVVDEGHSVQAQMKN